jgi:hypothetical protein
VGAAAGQARLRDVSNGARLDEVVREMTAPELAQEELRQVGGRLFQQKAGVWTEASRGGAEPRNVQVKLYSAAYFDVLEALPELTTLLSQLGQVEVRGERVTLRFVGEGRESIGSEELLGLSRDFRGAGAPTPELREERR